jgi:hypothetical protein
MRSVNAAILGLVFCFNPFGAAAETMVLDVVFSPTNTITLDFENDSRHFVTLVQREGTATGDGVFEGAKVSEYGLHDVTLGEEGQANGYVEAVTTGGDVAYFKWRLRAFFVAGPEGKTKVVNTGFWELTGGTGQFANQRGVGTLALEFLSKTERRYLLKGDISPAP